MKKIFLVVAATAMLTGCGQFDRFTAQVTGHAESCINGVMYYQFASGVTVAYNPDGTLRTCK